MTKAFWIRAADLVFGDRLHALLLGILAHRPVVALTVEDKIVGCIGDTDPGHAVALVASVRDDEPLRLRAEVGRLCDESGSRADTYQALLDTYGERRKVNFAMIEQVAQLSARTAVAPSERAAGAPPPGRPGAHAATEIVER